MRIIFFGSDVFACPSLEALVKNRQEVLAVVTQPDKQKGRHLPLGHSAVKETAVKLGLNILQPDKINEPGFIKILEGLEPDLLVVVAYGKILSKNILSIPRIMPVNVHGSLLPKYRGAAPINWAIINGETETGITLIRMNELMDAGEIISQVKIKIKPAETAVTLREKLADLGAEALIAAVKDIQHQEKINLIVQDEKKVTLAPKLKKSDGAIDWRQDACFIHNRIKGLLPWPGSFTQYDKKTLKILESAVVDEKTVSGSPGEVVSVQKEGITVATGKGLLSITAVQLEAAKPMPAWQFICGHKLKTGFRFLSQSP